MLAQFHRTLSVAIAHQTSMFIEINILGEQVKHETIARERCSRLLSPYIVERVMSGQLHVRLGGQRLDECTVSGANVSNLNDCDSKKPPRLPP